MARTVSTSRTRTANAAADLNRRLFGGTGYGWSPADEHARLTAQLARLDAEIARCDAEIARVQAERSAALLPLVGLAAVGQRIHDIDADRADQLARRNASNARVARWGIESRDGARVSS